MAEIYMYAANTDLCIGYYDGEENKIRKNGYD